MRRRDFFQAVAGLAVPWTSAARAQQGNPQKRIAVLLPAAADDEEYQTWIGAFLQALAQLGWNIGTNVRIDFHWATADAASIRKHSVELLARSPDVILAAGTSTVGPMLQATRDVPVVFPTVVDPVGAGFVE